MIVHHKAIYRTDALNSDGLVTQWSGASMHALILARRELGHVVKDITIPSQWIY